MSSRTSSQRLLLRGLVVPLTAFVALGVLVVPELLSQRELDASPARRPSDPDNDGLVNQQEIVLGTNRFLADSDGDGFSDLEEVARKTSPLLVESAPTSNDLSLGMTCSGFGSQLHPLIAIYLPDGNLRNKIFKAGILVNGRTIALSQSYLLSHGRIAVFPAADPAARVVTIELEVTPRYVLAYGHMSVFATVGDKALGVAQAADGIHVLAFGRKIVLELKNPMVSGSSGLGSSGQTSTSSGSGPVGSIYVPLNLGNSTNEWVPGQVCYQQTSVIGTSGARITQEVTSAECQTGWDGYCPSNCSATVGNTYTTIDPVALIGG